MLVSVLVRTAARRVVFAVVHRLDPPFVSVDPLMHLTTVGRSSMILQRSFSDASQLGKVRRTGVGQMNIGEAADGSGVTAKMIRYYESIGLLPKAGRRESGYRDYGEEDIHRLRFVKRARELGFSMDRIKALLALWNDQKRSNATVRRLASEHVDELQGQSKKLLEMIAVLRNLIEACSRGDRPHCPIMIELGKGPSSSKAGRAAHGRSSRASRRPH
jgi:MerR family copper efflux transcriptional regulator